MMRSLSAVILAAALVAIGARAADNQKDDPSQIGDRKIGKCVNFYSIEKEIALGKQLAEEVQRQAKLSDDAIITEYVNRIGQNLVRNSDAKVPFTFQVIQDDVPNAFALPGGFIFVNTGLIKIASEEDEFAGAIAHEIAHVAARHMTCQATKQQLASIASIPVSILLGGGWAGYAGRQAMGMVIPTAFLKFSRADESEADYLGTQYLYAAGYDPNGAVSIFEKLEALQKTRPGFASRVFSTHPMDATRIDKTQKEIERILPEKPEYIVSTSEYRDMRERLIRLENRRKADDPRHPQLRVAPGSGRPDDPGDDKDERPTIRRRELIQ
jgi:predicted Zn-dependent protease